ncbi:hypothetical protein ACHAQJ_006208 [Trichoderma viride]
MAEISSPKPHILIIPGGWHPVSCMDDFVKSLQAAGFPAQVVPTRSVGTRDVTVQDDEAQVKALLTPLIDQGRDVVIIGHSYGGMVATGVIAGLDKRRRDAQGLKGGVLGVIYLTAFVPLQHETLAQMSGGEWLPFVIADKASLQTETFDFDIFQIETEGLLFTKDEKESFYSDCSAEVAARVTATLKGQSVVAFQTAPSAIGWQEKAYDGRRGYIRCSQDIALPINFQDQLIARSGVDWVVRTCDSSHSPYLSMPDELTGVVAEMVAEFAKN